MAIIAEMWGKGKRLLNRIPEETLTVLLIVVACFGSFGLGVVSGQDTREGGIQIQQLTQVDTIPTYSREVAPTPSIAAGGQYVASRSGKSYHLPWCSGAKQIKEENKIWFASKEAAEAAGYTAAKNCKGI